MGQFSDFLSEKQISPDALLQASRRLESLRSSDRELVLAREAHRRKGAKESYDEAGIQKPRSGRPLRPGHVQAAMSDRPVPGPVRTKFVRAVNHLLQKKGQEPIRAPQLFGEVKGKQGKKPR